MAGIRVNRVKSKLQAGEVATVVSGLGLDADIIDSIGTSGVDGVWFEGEHGGVDYAAIGDLTRACDLWGMTSVVRVGQNQENVIYRTLDRGAQGIVVPHVNTRAEAEAVIAAGKFAPVGNRGMFTSRQGYGVDDYYKVANDQSLLIVLIEDIVAIGNLDEILKVDHIDVFFIAPSDLAQSMGRIGQLTDPDVQRTIDDGYRRIVAAGRTAGSLGSEDNVEHYAQLGVRFFMTGVGPWITSGAQRFMGLASRAAGA